MKDTQKSTTKNSSSKFQTLFEKELKDIYWAEKALTKAIPKMVKKATSTELVDALETHLEETEEHVARLEEVFSKLGKSATARKCESMEGLIKEAEEITQETEEGVLRDAAIIASAQKIEHYEIAAYGTLRTFAKRLELDEIVGLLDQTLAEEKHADEKLTNVAESSVNAEAAEH